MEAKFLTPKRKLIVTMLMFSTLGLVRHGILFPSGVVVLFRAAIGFLFLAALFAFGCCPFRRRRSSNIKNGSFLPA